MEIEFQNADLKQLCENSRFAQRTLGIACTRRLRSRIADLLAATRLADVQAGRPHALTGDKEGQFAFRLAGGIRLVVVPIDDPVPQLNPEGIDWANVAAVRIVYVGDYHD